jgi:hypothetical protein
MAVFFIADITKISSKTGALAKNLGQMPVN